MAGQILPITNAKDYEGDLIGRGIMVDALHHGGADGTFRFYVVELS